MRFSALRSDYAEKAKGVRRRFRRYTLLAFRDGRNLFPHITRTRPVNGRHNAHAYRIFRARSRINHDRIIIIISIRKVTRKFEKLVAMGALVLTIAENARLMTAGGPRRCRTSRRAETRRAVVIYINMI